MQNLKNMRGKKNDVSICLTLTNERVLNGIEAWKQGNINKFGELISQSGMSSINYYECGCPELISIYEILCNTPGVYGARFSGAGYRGCCIGLIDPNCKSQSGSL